MDSLNTYLQRLIHPPEVYYLCACILVLLLVLYAIRRYRTSCKGIVPFKGQGGTVEVAPKTLRGLLQNAANSVEGVEKAHCRHFVKGRRLGIKVSLHLSAQSRLKDVELRVKRRIRDTLQDQFGMENVEPIHIRVTRIIGDPLPTTPSTDFDEEPEPQRMDPEPESLEDEGLDEPENRPGEPRS
jgi:hypothetical protein